MTIELATTWSFLWEAVKEVFAFIGICISAHYLAFAISWGWGKGRAKIPTASNWYVRNEEKK